MDPMYLGRSSPEGPVQGTIMDRGLMDYNGPMDYGTMGLWTVDCGL